MFKIRPLINRFVVGWQYNPYGSRRHSFAWTYTTGHSFIESVIAAIKNRSGRRG